MQFYTIQKVVLALLTGVVLTRLPAFIVGGSEGVFNISMKTGGIMALFFSGIFWTQWFSIKAKSIVALLFSVLAASALFWVWYDVTTSVWLLMFIAVCSGASWGIWLEQMFSGLRSNSIFSSWYLLGIAGGQGLSLIMGKSENNSLILGILLLISNLFIASGQPNAPKEKASANRYQTMYGFVFLGMMLYELWFWTWSGIVLENDNQNGIWTIAIAAGFLFLFRMLGKLLSIKYANPGLIFVAAICFMVSVGMIYKITNPVWFALSFGASVGIMLPLIIRFVPVEFHRSNLKMVGFVLTIISMLVAIYLENHLEYIRELRLPAQVWMLSSRQALVKESAVFAGIIVLITGYLYLMRHKSWAAEVKSE